MSEEIIDNEVVDGDSAGGSGLLKVLGIVALVAAIAAAVAGVLKSRGE